MEGQREPLTLELPTDSAGHARFAPPAGDPWDVGVHCVGGFSEYRLKRLAVSGPVTELTHRAVAKAPAPSFGAR